MSTDQDPVTKLPKLTCSADYIHWRRRVYAYIRRNDFELLCFEDEPLQATMAVKKRWMQAMIKAKTTVILSLGFGPLAQLSNLIDDDDRTAKELWEAIARLYTTSNTQVVLNLQSELDQLKFKDSDDWEKHVDKFNDILGKLASYDSPVPEDEKASKLIKTLPESFAPLAMFSEASEISYDRLCVVVAGELSRRKNTSTSSGVATTPVAGMAQGKSASYGISGNIQKEKKKQNGNCYVCGKSGHFASQCWYRQDKPCNFGPRGRGRGFSGRGRGRGRGSYRGGYRGGYNGRGFGRGFGGWGQQHHQAPTWPPANNGNNDAHIKSLEGQLAQAHLAQNNTPPIYPVQYPQSSSRAPGSGDRPFGFMAKLKFRSSVAQVGIEKTHDALIDSGGTHHFFHSRQFFNSYESMNREDVLSASGTSIIVGKGDVWIPLQGGMFVEAYHTPHFSANILSVGMISKHFNTLFTSDPPAKNGISTCFIMQKLSNNIIYSAEIDDGLFKMKLQDGLIYADYERFCGNAFSTQGILEDPTKNTTADIALGWHRRTGHPSVLRYQKLSQIFYDVPQFPRKLLEDLFCIDCSRWKAKRAPITSSVSFTRLPLERIHLDIAGPIRPPSLSGFKYALVIIDDCTAKSDVFFLEQKSQLTIHLLRYIARAERVTGCKLLNIRLDRAGENSSQELQDYCVEHGIVLEYSPPYAPQSNGTAERLVQELSLRGRVLLNSANMDDQLWAEAMHHGNWLRNRLPSERIDGDIPITRWDSSTKVNFKTLPIFGQQGYAFIYTSNTLPRKKFSARALLGHFVGLQSDETLLRIYVPEQKRVHLTRAQDFKIIPKEKLPSISTLLDGLSRQSQSNLTSDEPYEEALIQAFLSYRVPLTYAAPSRLDHRLPRSFKEAIKDRRWCEAIDREFNALVKRHTWTYVRRESYMSPLPYTWVFRLKTLDPDSHEVLHKARCCVRGDLQEARIDYDPDATYAPVASHESIRLLFAIAARDGLIVEGGDVSNAYLYGDIDVEVLIEQPTDSSGREAQPGQICKLLKSMYGLKQAGNIWGSLLCGTLLNWKFTQSTVDQRVFFLQMGNMFVIVVIVVDDMSFVSNSPSLLDELKSKLKATFDIKLFGSLKTFIGWEVSQQENGIKISQRRYTNELLRKYGLHQSNASFTPLPVEGDFSPAHSQENRLSSFEHRNYRTVIGELLYLAVSTRPDISFSVSVLARHVHDPTARHALLVKRILRYLSGTRDQGLFYPRTEARETVGAFVDADWAGCLDTRQSTTGYIITLGHSPVSWRSQRQTVVALSSAEAEYIALSSCAKELTWMRRIYSELTTRTPYSEHSCLEPSVVREDNTAAMSLASNDVISTRNKHIDIKTHHVRDLLRRKELSLTRVRSSEQLADMLTKAVDRYTLRRHSRILLLL